MNRIMKFAVVALLMGTATTLFAQEKEEETPIYQFTETINVKHTPVDNQGSSGTCWGGNCGYNFYTTSPGYAGAFGGNREREGGWISDLVDTNLKWETTEMTNFGIDFAFLNDWDITLDYFIKNTKDLLLYRQLRPTAGYTQIYTNDGEIENKGFEFAVGYHKQFNKDFGFNARLTGSTIKNKVKRMGNGEPLYSTCSSNSGTIDGSQVGAIDGNGDWNNHSISIKVVTADSNSATVLRVTVL